MDVERLDLDALERALHSTAWATHDRCTCIACENGRALIAELRQTRAELDALRDACAEGTCRDA